MSIYFNFVTNTQAVPDLTTNLDENLALSPDLHFAINHLHLANCSQDTMALYPNTILLTLKFPTDQIIGIKREINSILNSQLMDSNVINFQFLHNTASWISKLVVKSYIEDLQTYRVKVRKQKKEITLSDDNQEDHAPKILEKVQGNPQSIFSARQ